MSIQNTTKHTDISAGALRLYPRDKPADPNSLLRTSPSNSEIHSGIAERLKSLIEISMKETYGFNNVMDVLIEGSSYYATGDKANVKNGTKFWCEVFLYGDGVQNRDTRQQFIDRLKANLEKFGFFYGANKGTIRDSESSWRIKLKVDERPILEKW